MKDRDSFIVAGFYVLSALGLIGWLIFEFAEEVFLLCTPVGVMAALLAMDVRPFYVRPLSDAAAAACKWIAWVCFSLVCISFLLRFFLRGKL